MSNENSKITKRSVLITVNKELHGWAKENISNFSGFVESSLTKFSASIAENSKSEESSTEQGE